MNSRIKIFLYTAAVIIVIAAASIVFLFNQEPDLSSLNPVHRYLSFSIYNTWSKYFDTIPEARRSIVSFDSLMDQLNRPERIFAEKIFSINPAALGFKGPFYGRHEANNLVMLQSLNLKGSRGVRETGIQYCPKHSYIDYERMMTAMQLELGRRLYVDSGYRSPGRQAYLFFYYLVLSSEYSLKENAKWIAMPGYSEHGSPTNNAIDFVSQEGINGFDDGQSAADFEKLAEYNWLLAHAPDFNFKLSYPKNNGLGVAYEPWHWHWDGDSSAVSGASAVIK